MTSMVDIYNTAVQSCGNFTIADPNENTEPARHCRAAFPLVRDAELRAHPWNCALERAVIAAAAAAPAWGDYNRFLLPTNPYCLRVWRLADDRTEFKVEGRYLLTTAAAPLSVLYIKRVISAADLDPLCAMTIALRLGHRIAPRLNASAAKRDELFKEYLDVRALARSIDGQEGTPEAIEASEFEDARL